ncbi:hypothetical protein HA402_016115 [Bradysia odoriphaga]|nr:hypothetical protein HA402_016115 [Bradysia odoriphaga]
MKCLVVLLFSLCTFHTSWGEIRTAGYVIRMASKGISGRAVLTPDKICTGTDKIGKSFCNGDPTVCDSTAVVTCTTANSGYTVPCPAEKPFCGNSALGTPSCAATPPEECPDKVSNFQCTGVGNYPDPANCKIYHNCYMENSEIKEETISCPPGYVFDPNSASKQFCLYTSTPSKCVTVTGCDGTTTKNIPINYTNNAQFVALCLPAPEQPLIFQCPTGTKPNLDDLPVSCTFTCKTEGQFAYTPDRTYYYECRFDSAKKLYSTLKPCPAGHEFEKTVCVRL